MIITMHMIFANVFTWQLHVRCFFLFHALVLDCNFYDNLCRKYNCLILLEKEVQSLRELSN